MRTFSPISPVLCLGFLTACGIAGSNETDVDCRIANNACDARSDCQTGPSYSDACIPNNGDSATGSDDPSAEQGGADGGSTGAVSDAGSEGVGAGGDAGGDTNADSNDAGEPDTPTPPTDFVPLYDAATPLNPALQSETDEALITRFADRARDRHAREDQFQAYDHYLSFYWEHRTVAVEIVDTVAKGGTTITFNVETQWRLSPMQAELRFFYRGMNTVAEYYDNGAMTPIDNTHYTRSVSYNPKTNAPLAIGDRLEFELSQFLDAPPRGRSNYYGTTMLYLVGIGLVPWEARGVFGDPSTEREDSYPIANKGWSGGQTTIHRAYSAEPDNHFMQMAGNLADIHGQAFVLGRRIHHTDMGDGSHDESPANPPFAALQGKLGPRYVNRSCDSCHTRNGRALPPAIGQQLTQHVVKVSTSDGSSHPDLGNVFQPGNALGASEGQVMLAGWDETDGLRSPQYTFSGTPPESFSVRLAPQLVGMGLLEAIAEEDILAHADPDDVDGDGVRGIPNIVTDPETGDLRVGRFGWTADHATIRHQVASALQTDMGVLTSVFPEPDCGSAQTDCGSGIELDETKLEQLTLYNSLLGIRPRRALDNPQALQGEELFEAIGCARCHTPSFTTSEYHPLAELRGQTIWPYTDLLLHDMGPGLADFGSNDSLWRTPPLWSIGLTSDVSGGEAYLHDGRARTVEEAILWHGGEGANSRESFAELTDAERAALLQFLDSL